MKLDQSIVGLLEVAVIEEIRRVYELPLIKDDGNVGVCVINGFHIGVSAIDMPTRVVVTNWAKSILDGKPVISRETSGSTPDFWENYDRAQMSFMISKLNLPLSLSPRLNVKQITKSVDSIYSDILNTATFNNISKQESKKVAEAKALLFVKNQQGEFFKSEGYLKFIELRKIYHNMKENLNKLPNTASNTEKSRKKELVEGALTALNFEGGRLKYQSAEKIVNIFEEQKNTEDDRSRLQGKLESNLLSSIAEPGQKYPVTTLASPDILNKPTKGKDWIKIIVKGSAIKDIYKSEAVELLGLKKDELKKIASKLYAVKAATRIFDIERKWLEWGFFNEAYWTYDKLISDGKGGGILPAIPDGLIVMPFFEITEMQCKVECSKLVSSSSEKSHTPLKFKALKQEHNSSGLSNEQLRVFNESASRLGISPPRENSPPYSSKKNRVWALKLTHNNRLKPPVLRSSSLPLRSSATLRERFSVRRIPASDGFVEVPLQKKTIVSLVVSIALHEDVSSDEVSIQIVENNNGEFVNPIITVKNKDELKEYSFSKSLSDGNYKLTVLFRGEESYAQIFSVNSDTGNVTGVLKITIGESVVITNIKEEGNNDNFLLPVFGYRVKPLPPAPKISSGL